MNRDFFLFVIFHFCAFFESICLLRIRVACGCSCNCRRYTLYAMLIHVQSLVLTPSGNSDLRMQRLEFSSGFFGI